jgi:hypothetical protein
VVVLIASCVVKTSDDSTNPSPEVRPKTRGSSQSRISERASSSRSFGAIVRSSTITDPDAILPVKRRKHGNLGARTPDDHCYVRTNVLVEKEREHPPALRPVGIGQ